MTSDAHPSPIACRLTAVLLMTIGLTPLAMATAVPALADGGRGGAFNGTSAGAGGADSTTGAGGTGSISTGSQAGAGGGGSGATGGGTGGNVIGAGGGTGGTAGAGAGGSGGNGGNGGNTAGGGGGGGGNAGLFSGGSTTTTTAVTGGSGGRGGIGNGAGGGGNASGGGGGAGGDGAIVSSGTYTITAAGSATGGTAGAGGASNAGGASPARSEGGNGGSGGIGVFLGSGATLNNAGTVTGGMGGAGGAVVNGTGTAGTAGAGGAGVMGSGITIVNSGTITGGSAGGGGAQANAITFTGGTNSLTLQAGSTINGNVVAFSSADTLALGGSGTSSFNVSQIGAAAQYRNFGVFQVTGGTWTLTGTTASTTSWAINGGTLAISSDSNLGAAAGTLSLDGGTLQTTSTFTSARSITLNSGGGAFTPNSGTTLTLSGGIGGAGGLTMNGAGTLALSGINTYSGGTTLSGGILAISSDGNLGSTAGSLTFNGGALQTTSTFTSARGITLNSGGGTVNPASDTTLTLSGAIGGAGGLTLNGPGTLALTGASTYAGRTVVNAGSLVVTGSVAGTVVQNAGNTTLIGGSLGGLTLNGGTASLNGTITGTTVASGGTVGGNAGFGSLTASGATLAPGNSIGTFTVTGNFAQSAGIYQVEVNAQGQSDRINVAGTATLSGGTVQVIAAAGTYATSTTYTIVNATGGVSGAYSSVSSNFAFLTPSLSYTANSVLLTLALQGNAFSGFGGNTANQRRVGSALDQSYANASGDFATVIGALANLSTAQASPALNAISGQQYADFGSVNVASSALFMNALGQQMALARGGAGSGQRQALAEACDVAACDGVSPFSVWGSALGGLGSVQGNDNSSTLTYNFGGGAAGIDYRFDPRIVVGLGVGYTSGTQWVDSFMGRGWSNNVNVAAYASFAQAGFYVDALAGYGYSNNQMQRQIVIAGLQPRQANGSTGANQFLGQVETGYAIGVYAPAQATVTPFARFQAASINQASFTEWGANSLDLNVAQQTTTSLRTTLGADLAGTIGPLNIGLRLGWLHDYADTARPMTAAFTGAPAANFTVYGARPQRDAAVIGLQASTTVAAATQIYLRYDGEVGSGNDNHALNAGMRLSF